MPGSYDVLKTGTRQDFVLGYENLTTEVRSCRIKLIPQKAIYHQYLNFLILIIGQCSEVCHGKIASSF